MTPEAAPFAHLQQTAVGRQWASAGDDGRRERARWWIVQGVRTGTTAATEPDGGVEAEKLHCSTEHFALPATPSFPSTLEYYLLGSLSPKVSMLIRQYCSLSKPFSVGYIQ